MSQSPALLGQPLRIGRRSLLRAGLLGSAWLTPLAHVLAAKSERGSRARAQSLIFIWLGGGPSQLETFDPHPGKRISGDTRAIDTSLKGVQLAAGLERTAEELHSLCAVRNLVSKEGDHERGAYYAKTGYRPDPTIVHPSIGAICCHELPVAGTEIPRHISILPDRYVGRGGLLGSLYDAFKTFDPAEKVPDATPRVSDARNVARFADAQVVERAFRRGRESLADATMHTDLVARARRMMTSEQLRAFEVSREPAALLAAYGDTPFGRGCLAARRLIEVGVRCVEVTLDGWDSHANNAEIHQKNIATLDPALSALVADLRAHDLLDRTVLLVGGEFGRTPAINRLGGRDHWPHGYSMLVGGGGLRSGVVLGETDPEGSPVKLAAGTALPDLHATILTALGIDPAGEMLDPIGRPIKFSEGKPLASLLS